MENQAAEQPTVLLVDDDEGIRESVRELLEYEKVHVELAENGEVGLELLKSKKPRVILLDIRMPVMDGWQFEEERLKDPELSKIPTFVFCTGNKNSSKPPGIHPTGFLSKPIEVDDLLNAIKPFLN